MIAREMWDFRLTLSEEGIVFCYSGFMTEEILFGIGDTLKKKLIMEKTEKKVARGVFALFVEQVQNVIRYSTEVHQDSDDPDSRAIELRYGVLTIGQKDDRYFVACANLIPNRDVERLRNNLTEIQSLDKKDLKTLYKKLLRKDPPEGSKGAGVGFVEIARRAAKGFDFDFYEADSRHSYFAIKAYI